MKILNRTRNHIWVKVDANEVISGITDTFATVGYKRTQIIPIGLSNGLLQASLGDLTEGQQQSPNSWTWAFVDLEATATMTKIDMYPYYRASQNAVVVFASLD